MMDQLLVNFVVCAMLWWLPVLCGRGLRIDEAVPQHASKSASDLIETNLGGKLDLGSKRLVGVGHLMGVSCHGDYHLRSGCIILVNNLGHGV